VTDLADLIADVETAIGAATTVLGDITARAQALKRQADEGLVTRPWAGGELYRMAKAVRAGTAVTLERLDRGDWPGRTAPPGSAASNETDEKE
jgi:hypothetical protein